ncbi:hypothetical protein [Coraliomargarita parva]|uniref:hypothetical protein n=1 Tax=Coraliomargarita parva TaxID=3014050 RepID=UPI0022B32234|nr:hypothetical protein [Coraliomargarita parva]
MNATYTLPEGAALPQPWYQLSDLPGLADVILDGTSLTLLSSDGHVFGTGILDRRDPLAAWRRFSPSDTVAWDESYLSLALQDALERRAEEACQRLVNSDADYLPGFIAECYGDVLLLSAETAAADASLPLMIELFREHFDFREIVLMHAGECRRAFGLPLELKTVSGNNLKGFWVDIDGLSYRIDPLRPEKPGFVLDLREQHALVGSLCAGRRVLSLGEGQGAFGLQALRAEAELAHAVTPDEVASKAIGANAQKNGLGLSTECAPAMAYLESCQAADYDALVLEPSVMMAPAQWVRMHRLALQALAPGGILATYCRIPDGTSAVFESALRESFAVEGREGRVFAAVGQPFDFPWLMQLPQTKPLGGFILQVE